MIDLSKIPSAAEKFGLLNGDLNIKLDDVSEEFFKKGTLATDTLDWSLIEIRSSEILMHASHMLAFRGLILALIEKQQLNALVHAFDCTRTLLKEHYPKLHPKGKKFQKMKANWVTEIVSGLTKASDHYHHDLLQQENKEIVADFCTQADLHEFDVSSLKRILSEVPMSVQRNDTKAPLNRLPSAQETEYADARDLDAKGRAQLRREIQALAYKIFSHDPNAGISYEMRGYVGWMEFQFLPEADESGTTQLQKIPNSLYEEHKRGCDSATVEELYKLEERLISNPDWFEGHRLAYETSLNMGFEDAAKAITNRVRQRLKQWPKLNELKYSNNVPFIDEEIKQWTISTVHQSEPDDGTVGDKTDDLDTLVASVNASVEASKSTREKATAKFRLLKGFKKMGYTAQAKIMANELNSDMNTLTVKDWDQHFLKEVETEKS